MSVSQINSCRSIFYNNENRVFPQNIFAKTRSVNKSIEMKQINEMVSVNPYQSVNESSSYNFFREHNTNNSKQKIKVVEVKEDLDQSPRIILNKVENDPFKRLISLQRQQQKLSQRANYQKKSERIASQQERQSSRFSSAQNSIRKNQDKDTAYNDTVTASQALRPQSQLWYPAVSDFQSQISSNFEGVFKNKLEERKKSQEKQSKPQNNLISKFKTASFSNSQFEFHKLQPIENDNNSLSIIPPSSVVKQQNVTFYNPSKSSLPTKNRPKTQLSKSQIHEEGDLLFKFGDQNNYWFNMKDVTQHQMYEASLVQISRRSKFKVYQNIDIEQQQQKEVFLNRCGTSSQNMYKHERIKNQKDQSFYGRASANQGGNRFWPVIYTRQGESDENVRQQSYEDETHKLERKQYQADLVRQLQSKRHREPQSQIASQEESSSVGDMSSKLKAFVKSKLRQNHASHNKHQSAKNQDSFDKYYSAFVKKEDGIRVEKNAPLDQEFMNKISEIKSGGNKMYKAQLSDKLIMFQKVDDFSKDLGLRKEFNELLQRRKNMLKAMEQIEKEGKFK